MKEGFFSILDRVFAVLGAFIFAQIPQLYQQYTLLLSGHLSELALLVRQMENSAKATSKTLNELIQKFLASTDVDFHNQGLLMQSTYDRWHEFSVALQSLSKASVFTRPFAFMKHFNFELFKETLDQFTVGFSLTFESIVYALIGIFFGYLLFKLIRSLFFFKKFPS